MKHVDAADPQAQADRDVAVFTAGRAEPGTAPTGAGGGGERAGDALPTGSHPARRARRRGRRVAAAVALAVVGAVVGMGAGAAIGGPGHPYGPAAATAHLLVDVADPNTPADADAGAAIVRRIATDPSTVRAALAGTGARRDPAAVARQVVVTPVGVSRQMTLTAHDADGAVAVHLADALAKAVVDDRQRAAVTALAATLSGLDRQITDLEDIAVAQDGLVAAADRAVTLAQSPGERAADQANADATRADRQQTGAQLAAAEAKRSAALSEDADRNKAAVVSPAGAATWAHRARPRLPIAAGGVAGVLVALAGGALVTRRTTRRSRAVGRPEPGTPAEPAVQPTATPAPADDAAGDGQGAGETESGEGAPQLPAPAAPLEVVAEQPGAAAAGVPSLPADFGPDEPPAPAAANGHLSLPLSAEPPMAPTAPTPEAAAAPDPGPAPEPAAAPVAEADLATPEPSTLAPPTPDPRPPGTVPVEPARLRVTSGPVRNTPPSRSRRTPLPVRPPMTGGAGAARLDPARLRRWAERFEDPAVGAEQLALLRRLELRRTREAEQEYRTLVELHAPTPGARSPRPAPNPAPRVHPLVTTDGMFGPFGPVTLDQMWRDLLTHDQVYVTLPKISAPALDQLLRLCAQAEAQLDHPVDAYVRTTA